MRTTEELIAELETEAKKHAYCAIVIRFESATLLITAKEPDRRAQLSDAIRVGGMPMGLLAFDMGDDLHKSASHYHVYPEHEAEHDEAETYMQGFIARVCEKAKRRAG